VIEKKSFAIKLSYLGCIGGGGDDTIPNLLDSSRPIPNRPEKRVAVPHYPLSGLCSGSTPHRHVPLLTIQSFLSELSETDFIH
jgi:hypothetical protein